MLRIHFTDADLGRTRIAARPDLLWEIVGSLHRLQVRRGRWAYADWFRSSRERFQSRREVQRGVRSLLLPLVPYAAYFPDFLTPPEADDGLAAGLAALRDTPRQRVEAELRTLAASRPLAPAVRRIAGPDGRAELVRVIRQYHDALLGPVEERMLAAFEAERALRARAWLDNGAEGLLRSLAPNMIWEPPVLRIPRYPVDQDLYLDGRGLRLVPAYFCWGNPIAYADPELTPVLVYGLRESPVSAEPDGAALEELLGRTRARVLRAAAAGATTGELARAVGVSAPSVSQHAGVLRNSKLLTSRRNGTQVLHSLTPAGAALLASGAGGTERERRNRRDRTCSQRDRPCRRRLTLRSATAHRAAPTVPRPAPRPLPDPRRDRLSHLVTWAFQPGRQRLADRARLKDARGATGTGDRDV